MGSQRVRHAWATKHSTVWSTTGMWPLPWLLCHRFKFLVEVASSVLWGLGSFHKRVKAAGESQVEPTRAWRRLANWGFSFGRWTPCWTYFTSLSFQEKLKICIFVRNSCYLKNVDWCRFFKTLRSIQNTSVARCGPQLSMFWLIEGLRAMAGFIWVLLWS